MTTEQQYRKPLPNAANEELTKPYWEATKRHELVMQRCKRCSSYVWYPRELCTSCLGSDLEWVKMSGKGRLYSYTVIYQPASPVFRDDVPYVFAMIQLDEGPRMVANLIDVPLDQVQVEMPVQIVFDDVTPEVTLPKWKPA
jgi:uncharacterized OB-fold protein